MSFGGRGRVIKKSHEVKGIGNIEEGVYRLSLTEERPVKKVVHDETIGLVVFNEHPELTKARARGWYLLPRCTVHVCNSRDMFVDYRPVTGHEVVLDNNDHVEVVGFGTVKLQLDTGKILTLENVFHIPTITKCLVSVAKLTDIVMDCTVTFCSKECVITEGHEVIGKAYREDELYRLSLMEERPVKKLVHDETIGLLVFNEHPELTKARARGWYLLSRCTVHVCNSRDMFVDYRPVTGHEVVLDNNDHVEVVGFGTVKLQLDTGKILTLENVFHIPTITKCLVSVAKLTDIVMDCTVTFCSKECVITEGHEVIGKAYREDELYRLSLMEERPVKKVVHDETIGLVVFNEHPKLTKARARGWYLLPRCTVHVCNSRDMFIDYRPVTGHEVVLDNNDHVEVVGFGTVKLQLDTGKILTLENVFHIPTITKCLVSVAKLTDIVMDCTVTFRSKECVITEGHEVIGKAYREDELYRLSLMEEHPVKKVVHDETIGLVVFNEHPELTKARARGWYLLSRCTVHVCNSRDMFVDYRPVTGHEVVLDNNDHVEVVGFGTVKLQLDTGKILTLENVFHIPTITKCLVSVAKLTDIVMDCTVTFCSKECVITEGHEVIGKAYREDELYRSSLMEERPVKKVVHDETIGLVVFNEHPKLTKARARGWYLLPRCTVHVCNSRDMFIDYRPVTGHEVVLDNNDHVEVVGFGTVKLQLDTGKILTLENVFHIPTITKCLVSVAKLTDIVMDCTVTFRSKECVITEGHEVIGKAYREDELYRLSLMEEHPVKKVVHDETIGLVVFNEHPELTKARARGWYLLSRCTVHVCNSRDMFVDYRPVTGHEVVLDNNDHVEVVGFGTVKLQLDTGKILTLENVFHIPTITKCLVSVAKLTDIVMDCTVTFCSKECVITEGHEVIGKAYREDELYRSSLMEERPVKKVVHDETIGLVVFNEHPELTKARARGWYLLPRCTVHVCNSRDMFVDYRPVTGHEVVLDNNDHVEVVGFGTVKLQLDTGKILTLENVFHIPTITKCLVSVAKLTDIVMDCTVTFRSKECVITEGHEVIGKAYREDELYRLSLMEERPVKKVVHDETIGLVVFNEHPELTKARARGWYLLSRCTVHVCNSRDMFVDYQPVTGHEVVLENNSRVDVVGFGTVKLRLTTGRVLTLKNVFHMPSIIKCCISVNKLMEMGLGVGFDAEGCYVKKGQQIVGNGFVEDGLFRLGVIDECSCGNQA